MNVLYRSPQGAWRGLFKLLSRIFHTFMKGLSKLKSSLFKSSRAFSRIWFHFHHKPCLQPCYGTIDSYLC